MNMLLALFMFLLLSITALAQQSGVTNYSFDGGALVSRRASLVSYGVPEGNSNGWLYNGVRTNVERSPDLGFLRDPLKGSAKLLAVSSDSPKFFQGFQAVTRTTRYTPATFGEGAAAGSFGGVRSFASRGDGPNAVATRDDFPYQLKTDALFANSYSDSSAFFLPLHPVYTAPTGSDRYTGTGFNLGNMFKAIGARGRLMTSAVHHVSGLAQRTAKLY